MRKMSLIDSNSTFLIAAGDWFLLAERVAELLPPASPSLLVLSAQLPRGLDEPVARALCDALKRRDRLVETVAPLPAGLAGWIGSRGRRWRSVDLHGRGNRLIDVKLLEELLNGAGIVVVNDLGRFDPKRPAIAIAVWAQFAHPRQRLGASLGDQASGLVAEIALAAPAAWYVIAGSWLGKPMAVVANDMIAAELVGLAIGQAQADPDRELSGPWEHPLVQRATELDLGVRLPSDVNFSAEWLGTNRELSAAFLAFGASVAVRIGIAVAST
jgi:hypothetical protein